MIVLKNLCKSYKNGNKIICAVKNVSVSFREHEFISVLGPSGCGKTTLLNVIGGLDKKDSGDVIVNGQSTQKFTSRDWDSYRNYEVGFVFQDYYLIPHLNVFDNIVLTLKLSNKQQNQKEQVLNVLKVVGLEGLENKYPYQLSGGQMQRVAIARALINNPSVILADEPTGALDSKTAIQIMDLLKSISKEHLVIMVTHNKEMAETYSDRIIQLLDGEIIADSEPLDEIDNEKQYEKKRVHIPFLTALKLSLKNMWSKKIRNLLTMLAGAIGIVGVGLILSMSSGLNSYIKEVQKNSLGKYPVIVSSYLKTSSEANTDTLIKYPDDENVSIESSDYTYEHVNNMNDDFVDYMENIDSSFYTIQTSNSNITFRLITENESGVKMVSNSQFDEMSDDSDFVLTQYDILKGELPTKANELALVIDEYNRLDYAYLSSIGFDVADKKSITFNDILDKEYRFISNDDYYYLDESTNCYYSYNSNSYLSLFNNADYTLKVTAILREKPGCISSIYANGLLYTSSFTSYVQTSAAASTIGRQQKESSLTYNVFSGQAFADDRTTGSLVTAQYQYERTLVSLGITPVKTRIYYYTDSFEARTAIADYIAKYEASETDNTLIRCTDYIEAVTTEFSSLVKIFTNILLVFSCISLVVAGIMIAIVAYISVTERRQEIGLLRSLGARKKDVLIMFMNEMLISGLLSGIIGVVVAALLCKPVSNIVKNLIGYYTSSLLTTTATQLAYFNWWIAPLLIGTAILLSLIAGLIPSLSGCRKPPVDSLKRN